MVAFQAIPSKSYVCIPFDMTTPNCYYEMYQFKGLCYCPVIIYFCYTHTFSTSVNIIFGGFSCVRSWTEAKFVDIKYKFSYFVFYILLVDEPCQFVFLHSCNTMLCPEL